MSIRPIREVPTAREVAEFISDFDRPSFGTLRGKHVGHYPQIEDSEGLLAALFAFHDDIARTAP